MVQHVCVAEWVEYNRGGRSRKGFARQRLEGPPALAREGSPSAERCLATRCHEVPWASIGETCRRVSEGVGMLFPASPGRGEKGLRPRNRVPLPITRAGSQPDSTLPRRGDPGRAPLLDGGAHEGGGGAGGDHGGGVQHVAKLRGHGAAAGAFTTAHRALSSQGLGSIHVREGVWRGAFQPRECAARCYRWDAYALTSSNVQHLEPRTIPEQTKVDRGGFTSKPPTVARCFEDVYGIWTRRGGCA